ncbi:MAG: thioredoxin domain-containing protein [Pseudomonadota bacterium]|nr:thioredoxin domain-containing protein [Pseudomonadota bacterium]
MIRETNDKSFRTDVLLAPGVTLVDFWAPTSGKSGVQAPILERFAAEHPTVRVLKVNLQHNPRLAGTFCVDEAPALLVFKDGQPLVASTGLHHSYAMERLITVAEARAERIPQA